LEPDGEIVGGKGKFGSQRSVGKGDNKKIGMTEGGKEEAN